MKEGTADFSESAFNGEGKYLTFNLADEQYGLNITKVKEINGVMPITPVPRTPDFVRGVMNLRGKVIPVVDLRMRFGMTPVEHTEKTCIIVAEIAGPSGPLLTGIVVDSVSEVLHIPGGDIEKAPSFGVGLDTQYILGLAKLDQSVNILLDIDRVLSRSEAAMLEDAL